MDSNFPNSIDNSGFSGNGYSNLQPLPNTNLNTATNYLNDPTIMFTSDSRSSFPSPDLQTDTSILDIQITITQQRTSNNTGTFSNATETSISFSSIGNYAQVMYPPLVYRPEIFSFEINGFKFRITVPICNPMFQQGQQYVIINNPQQHNQ
ncbi:hypothetical protein RclHR1_00080019 [Rhizophagus clarus]|uniref:Uncharacterized protein n=1 Tax=Rhizophagus clarus TaxID=94130 RepID=A0A2Z6SEN2_9GLOM|nr:hypothetical protein RclHR1_00080019 [Rhizophagus clarus]GET04058.1 hypothetical protein GLOIN_2v1838447 [Rhizophagus clarus]